jgi:hypothetical protein
VVTSRFVHGLASARPGIGGMAALQEGPKRLPRSARSVSRHAGLATGSRLGRVY